MAKAAVEIDYDRINTHIPQAVNSAVVRSTHTMLLPCLGLFKPFMDFALACDDLYSQKETHTITVGTTVHDAVSS